MGGGRGFKNGRSVGVGWGSVDLKSTRGGGGRRGQLRGKDCLIGTTGGGAWQGGSGIWVGVGCHVHHRRVDGPPQA